MANYRITDFQPKIAKEDLITLVNKCQERTFSEDIDYIEQKGGDQAFSELLGVDFNRGLDSGEITSRAGLYGTNQFEEIPMKGFFELMWTALEDFTLRILLVAAAVSVVANMIVEKDHREIAWIEGFTIFMAVMICSSVTALNDYQKEKQFRKLNEVAVSKKTVNVWRDAKLISVHESALVTGDIVKITEGMQLNADMMLLQAFDITIDEAALTGEANAIRKMAFRDCVESRDTLIAEGRSAFSNAHTYSPILMSGTTVLTGEGKAVVLVVGDQSCIGRIRSLVQQEPGQTPLQEKLEVIAEDIGKFGLVSAIITFFILLLRFFIDRFQTGTLGDFEQYLQIISYIIIAITVVVVAIPEGLPLAVTLSLAYSMHQMLKDNNLVRRMEATETMGGADNICTDKTGTLTQNKMTLTAFWNMRLNPIDGYKTGKLEEIFNPNCHNLIRQALACNSSATLSPVHGSKTEICLLEFLQRYGEDYERIRTRYLDNKTIRFPFSSLRKRMTTIIEVNDEGSGVRRRVHIKGAAEIILSCCRSMYDFDEMRIVPLTDKMRKTIETEIENMSDQALRTLCIAYKDIKESEDVTTKNSHDVFRVEEDDFIFLGILGVKDILRREVKVAIAECKAAGIKVRMVTGDNKTTAKAIARECGIIDPYDPNSLIMTGPEFMERVGGIVCKACQTKDCDCPKDKAQAERTGKEMRVDVIANSAEFDKIYSRLDVLARSRPEDKYALVAGLIERGAVVAVTGDGTNDAPALKKADVGFAMNSGTEVAKEAADIILIDDNFASIVESVKWGRNIYENIRKFLQFQLTVNVVAVGITLVGAGILKEAVFTAVQLLWMNLIMDTLASLALATETPHEQILGKRPYDRNEYILSSSMKKHIIGQAIYQFLIIIVLIFTGDKWIPESLPHDELEGTDGHQLKYYSDSMHVRSGRSYFITTGGYDYEKLESVLGPSRHFTIVFNTFVFLQVFNFLNCRKLNDERNIFKGITRNKFFLFIVILITILQVTIIKYGGLPMSVSFHGLDGFQWLICIGLASGSLVWSAILKRIHVDPHWAAIRQTIRNVSLPKKSKRDDSKAEKTRSFGRLPSIDLDTHDAYLGTDASPKKDQELGLLHIKAH